MYNIENEKRILKLMITIFCKKLHKNSQLCDNCTQLLQYANERVEKCPFKESKSFCSNCKVHCYNSDMREKIREVMRFSGPIMIFYHPIIAVKHIISTIKERNKKY